MRGGRSPGDWKQRFVRSTALVNTKLEVHRSRRSPSGRNLLPQWPGNSNPRQSKEWCRISNVGLHRPKMDFFKSLLTDQVDVAGCRRTGNVTRTISPCGALSINSMEPECPRTTASAMDRPKPTPDWPS